MPQRIHVALERWRAAERVLAATPEGSRGRADAEDAVAAAREEYLAIVRMVAEEVGPSGMPDLTETQLFGLERPTSEG
jgi:hypothetical protein